MATQAGKLVSKESILLTGGEGAANESVKENAIRGALSKNWIGVTRSGRMAFCEGADFCVIHTNLGNVRNYLEACLCDAAIVLPGGKGTKSEAIFAVGSR